MRGQRDTRRRWPRHHRRQQRRRPPPLTAPAAQQRPSALLFVRLRPLVAASRPPGRRRRSRACVWRVRRWWRWWRRWAVGGGVCGVVRAAAGERGGQGLARAAFSLLVSLRVPPLRCHDDHTLLWALCRFPPALSQSTATTPPPPHGHHDEEASRKTRGRRRRRRRHRRRRRRRQEGEERRRKGKREEKKEEVVCPSRPPLLRRLPAPAATSPTPPRPSPSPSPTGGGRAGPAARTTIGDGRVVWSERVPMWARIGKQCWRRGVLREWTYRTRVLAHTQIPQRTSRAMDSRSVAMKVGTR